MVNVTEEHILISEKVHATLFHTSSVDERIVVDIFQRLQGLNRFAIGRYSSKEDYNLKRSLERYEHAMYSFEKESAFKDLFTSLEKITDIKGKTLEGPTLDLHTRALSGTQSSDIQRWRLLNNRYKHSARNTRDIELIEEEEVKSPTMLSDLRKCVQAIILSKI